MLTYFKDCLESVVSHQVAEQGCIILLCSRDYKRRISDINACKEIKHDCVGCQIQIENDPVYIDKVNLLTERWHASCYSIYIVFLNF
jgi:hypothetical protein